MSALNGSRARLLGEFIVNNGSTVRAAAKVFGISKSTVHKEVTKRLERQDAALAARVRAVLDINRAQRHLRGGEATRRKYEKQRENRLYGVRISEGSREQHKNSSCKVHGTGV